MDKITHLEQQWKALQPLSKRKEYLLSQRFTVDYINKIMGGTKMGKHEKAPKAL